MDRDYGIQTLLMTDVVGSTRLWASRPAEMPRAVERLEGLAEAAIRAEGGELVRARGEGDSLFCLFSHPAAAARAAAALVAGLGGNPEGLGLQIRAAIHCGPAQARGTDLYGTVPNRCARLREIAHPDQILLSGAARSQIVAEDAIRLRDLGRHRLRDLDEPESVWQLLDDRLPDGFPPPRSLSSLRNNLPLQATSFVGRETLRRELTDCFAVDRLTTLTGAGGCGKTRLSLQLGADAIEAFPGGVWFVELAETTTEPAIVRAITEACGHHDLPEADAADSLAERLRGMGRTLFVLDNAEQALGPIGRVAAGLLATVPEVRLLVTSREPLRLHGERVHRVPPLSVPPPGCGESVAVAATEAGALFVERARLRLPDFALGPANALAVTEIVRRLDGIPLCLEMAASHVDYLGPDQIAARLHDRFVLLDLDEADVPPRHRTMRETIAWQYDTLGLAEKTLLQRLAAFAGGFDLDAAQAVGGPVRGLRALVEKSLVVAVPDGGEMRYRLLETIAQFASEQPEGEMEAAMEALLAWAVGMADLVATELHGPNHHLRVAQTDKSLASLSRALDWGMARAAPETAAAVLAMTRYWFLKGAYVVGRTYLESAIKAYPETTLGPELQNALGAFCNSLGDAPSAEAACRRGLERGGSRRTRLFLLNNLGNAINDQGRPFEALACYDEAILIARGDGNEGAALVLRYNRAVVLLDVARYDEAGSEFLRLGEIHREAGEIVQFARCRAAYGSVALQTSGRVEAAGALNEALDAYEASSAFDLLMDVILEIAVVALDAGRVADAALLDGASRHHYAKTGGKHTLRQQRQVAALEARLDATDFAVATARTTGAQASEESILATMRGVLKSCESAD